MFLPPFSFPWAVSFWHTTLPAHFHGVPWWAAIVLLLINVSVFSLYDRMIHLMQERHTALLIEKQNKAYQQQLQFMQKSQMRLRFLRHDMKNHLFQIKHFLETNDMKGMYTYINDLEDNLDLTQSITYTQHEAINSILNYKLLPLRTDGVALEVDVQLPDQLTYPIFDLNVLLGNLLDNAIEATALVTPERKSKNHTENERTVRCPATTGRKPFQQQYCT